VNHIESLKMGAHIQLSDGRLCGSNDNHKICVYNMDTNMVETMRHSTGNYKALILLQDGRICSCSHDESIKIWNTESS
jgi:tricorn protease-like protein